jgi:hypothetical protein
MVTPLHLIRRLIDVLRLSLAEANSLASYTEEEDFINAMTGALFDKQALLDKQLAEREIALDDD